MKLILSSCDFRNNKSCKCIIDNIDKPINKCKVLYFPNEKATKEAIEGEMYYNRLAEFGFCRENMYIFNYYKPDAYHNLDIDVIYISGGNTFATLDRIRKAYFDVEIKRYVESGVTYIGGSAGAHIASANIEHVMKYDSNTPGITDFKGLGLFDGILICHYADGRKEHFEKLQTENKYEIYSLTDDDSLIINYGKTK